MGIKPFPGTACESWISSSPSSTQLRNKPGREPHPFPTTPSQGSTQVAGNIAGWPLASHLEEKCCPLKHSSCMGTVSTSLVYVPQLGLTQVGCKCRATISRQHQLPRCENRNWRILHTDAEPCLNWERRHKKEKLLSHEREWLRCN